MKNTGGTTWRGTLIDTVTGKSDVIGEWMLPSSAGKMLNGRVGFFEYYNWSDGTTNHDCSKQPFSSQVFFGNPTSKTKGASGGKIIFIYEASECVKEAQPEGHSDWQGISDSGWFQVISSYCNLELYRKEFLLVHPAFPLRTICCLACIKVEELDACLLSSLLFSSGIQDQTNLLTIYL